MRKVLGAMPSVLEVMFESLGLYVNYDSFLLGFTGVATNIGSSMSMETFDQAAYSVIQ